MNKRIAEKFSNKEYLKLLKDDMEYDSRAVDENGRFIQVRNINGIMADLAEKE